jgi:hypothetical protein
VGELSEVEHDRLSFTRGYLQGVMERLQRCDVGWPRESHNDDGTAFDDLDLEAHVFLPEAGIPFF